MKLRLHLLALGFATGCWLPGQEVLPFTVLPDPAEMQESEARLWAESSEFDRALANKDFILTDWVPTSYLQTTLDGLFPSSQGRLKVRILIDPDVNAFSLPNGSIYIHLGLLARLANEAQAATVLAHEAGHVFARHGYQQQRKVKHSSAFALSSVLVAGPLGLLGALGATSSVYGFSRDQEREADRQSFEALLRSGYDIRESVKVFQVLAEDAKLQAQKQPFFFASHPKLLERIASFEDLCVAVKDPGTRTEAARFLERTASIRQAWMEAELSLARSKNLLYWLAKPEVEARFGSSATYYRGRALELRNQAGDGSLAEVAYRHAIQASPEFAPSYRALGLLLLRKSDLSTARELLAQYLARAPRAEDAAYINDYLKQLDQSAAKPTPQEP